MRFGRRKRGVNHEEWELDRAHAVLDQFDVPRTVHSPSGGESRLNVPGRIAVALNPHNTPPVGIAARAHGHTDEDGDGFACTCDHGESAYLCGCLVSEGHDYERTPKHTDDIETRVVHFGEPIGSQEVVRLCRLRAGHRGDHDYSMPRVTRPKR